MLHRFEFDGNKIVLDVHSGAVHLVDDLAWDVLEHYGTVPETGLAFMCRDRYRPSEIMEAVTEIKELERQGLLFSSDPCQAEDAPPLPGSRGVLLKALCLHLAHSCNLKCRYCFAGQGRFGGGEGLMSLDTGRSAIEFLLARSGGRKSLNIDFFGGEPLLNINVLKELVSYGRKRAGEAGKEIRYTLTTNAVNLDSSIGEFLKEHDISVVLSLDGRPEVHDTMRSAPGGTGSYEQALAGIYNYMSATGGANYVIRGTFTRRNLDFCSDVLHLAGLGFRNISLEPVVAPEESEYSLRREDLPLIYEQYDRLAREILRMRREGCQVNFFHFNLELDGGPCLQRRLAGCGAGGEYLAVTPEGHLYPCHQFVGRPGYLLGSLEEGIARPDLAALFGRAHIYNKDGCSGCWAKFYCSGGCHANAEAFNGTIFKPYALGCRLTMKRLECALYIKAATAV